MSFANPFVLPTSAYKRDINMLQHYVDDAAKYLSLMTGRSVNECREFVVNQVKPGGAMGITDPTVCFFERGENGDRAPKTIPLSKYLGESIRNKELIAPTLTTYRPPSEEQSILVDYVDDNVAARGRAKKAMFVAKVAKQTQVYTIKKIEQTNKKLSNNAISGGHVSASTPLYNKTAHSTLTSTCRSTSGYGNANNEKMLSGNRHYWSRDIVLYNIMSVINHTDYERLAATMQKWGIRAPSVSETMECIKYSAQLYSGFQKDYGSIEALVSRLNDLQRAAFVYTGDLYHLMRYNDAVIRQFIMTLSMRVETPHPDAEAILSNAPDDYKHLAAQICSRETKGKALNDLKGTEAYGIVGATCQNVLDTVSQYGDFIATFFVTTNVPASMAHFPDSIRRAALTSDTDSTIFTVQDWVEWYFGKVCFGEAPNAVAATMIFLASQAITHVLAMMSANFGIEEKRLHQIAMKNEFKFDVFVPTQVAKHYYALISCQEGNVYAEFDKEIKGVHLKSSNAPKAIMDAAKKMMEDIMQTVLDGRLISIDKILKEIADIERSIMASIREGGHDYFRRGQIKPPGSYTKAPHESPYQQYTMWNEVFGPKYGPAQEPPYTTIKLSVELDSPMQLSLWLDSLADQELANRMRAWLTRNNRRNLTTFMLPEQCIQSKGIPEEILAVVNTRKIVLDTAKVFYIICETLGIYMLNDRITRLISDTH